ncbi:hypothetical protein C8J56DRAFT_1025923 [Mycena floridula]|nr:hypothetical protein C8J56DRAFT_1025923 [Mycena floridula]
MSSALSSIRPAIDPVQQNRAEKKVIQADPFLTTKFWWTLRCHFTKYARITKSYRRRISLISALLSNMMFLCHIIDYDNRVLWGWAGWRTWSFSEVYRLVLFI